jgi:hypothetical protein
MGLIDSLAHPLAKGGRAGYTRVVLSSALRTLHPFTLKLPKFGDEHADPYLSGTAETCVALGREASAITTYTTLAMI